ncbi:MAG: type II secretion system protein [Planctomycetota bacterium]|jgi:prepilin-type N-terminal cleavage/methylation domain-containing protein/prepilin-type processing-associated H-X9-DG protein
MRARRIIAKRTAFTLIELLVVISILVLLIALLLPSLRRARNQSRAVVCQTNLRQWGTTLALYVEDNRGHLPRGGWIPILRGSSLHNDDPNGPEPLNPVDTKGIVFCPTATKTGGKVSRTFSAWETTHRGTPFRGSYGLNIRLFGIPFDPSMHTDKGGLNIFPLKDRANIPALLDAKHYLVGSFSAERDPPDLEAFGSGWATCCINRHNGHVNGLFLDWSVRKIGLKELWTLKWDSEFDTAGPWTRAGGVKPEDWPGWMRGFKDY